MGVFNSAFLTYYYRTFLKSLKEVFSEVQARQFGHLPWVPIAFTTAAAERSQQVAALTAVYATMDEAGVVQGVQAALAAGQSDVVHDLLAFLAEQMIGLNKQKQAEVKRFLGWLEGTLHIAAKKDGSTGLDSLAGKTILRGYLGDYQKGEPETAWADYHFRLHQNRHRFGVSLASVEAAVRREYEASLKMLRPIKGQLARTDALIDQIVYQLYGLTEAEIELIERPAYEEALAEAKAAVQQDKELKDDADAAFAFVSERVETAAVRLNELAPSDAAIAALDRDLPGWRGLSPRVQTLLQQAERDWLDEGRADYTGSQINYAKAVEVTVIETLFEPFRAAGFTEADVHNTQAFKPYMRGEKKLTLGNFPFLLSSKETAFRAFAATLYADAATRLFDPAGLLGLLSSDQIAARNGGAHEDVITRDAATEARAWTFAVLRLV